MKLGVLTVPLYDRSFEDALKWLSERGVHTLEVGNGGFPGNTHINPDDYLGKPGKIAELKALLEKYGMTIAALSCHGNCVHPDKAVAAKFQSDYEKTVLMAEQLGIDTVVTFSGCPGGSKDDKTPNWVTCPWPDDFGKILDYQWNEVLIPYWKEAVKFANAHGVKKIALEMHPGFCVYNTTTLLKLRDAVGDTIGANFDPSHLIWQGIEPAEGIRLLGKAIYHVHAKDTFLDEANIKKMGVLSTVPYSQMLDRPWTFRTVGYGLSVTQWKNFVSMLRAVGYDGVLSIEHEDMLMSIEEGLEKAIVFLKDIISIESTGEMWWA
mgnify:FL=1